MPKQMAEWCGGSWHPLLPDRPLTNLCVDSRQAGPGSLFFALKGERADGHQFLAEVAGAGACAVVLASRPMADLPAGGFYLRTEDPLAALGRIAAGYRATMPARIIGVSGSVGKTTVKELIADMLAQAGKTARTRGNFNNEIGLPLSLADLDRECRFGVFEAGISHPGEMAVLRDILRPDLAVMTGIVEAHIEFFESVRAIAEEKAELLEQLPPDGRAMLNLDDEFSPLLRARSSAPVVTWSLRQREADYAGDAMSPERLWVYERATGESAELPLPPPGGFMAANVMPAVAVARVCGVSWEAIAEALESFQPVGMRWAVEAVGGWTAINDAYNANPASIGAALRAFADWPVEGRRFLALGPMLEMGRREQAAHEALGRQVAGGSWGGVVVLARTDDTRPAADAILDGLKATGWPMERARLAAEPSDAAAWLRERLEPGDAVLFKASRGIRLEDVLERLKEER
ncbi:MAG: UDP-N-acetylmuramoyl-tripeptide--D-alanyl-D-alanine ligase [Lentisphaerae bacterium]|nr:UDP-N-acetylmuramoyl-tripeptide--D-alanyl-D-alanine ligase [Lentisphaerota bacterium]